MPTDIIIKGYGRSALKRVDESAQKSSKSNCIELEGVFGVVSDVPNRNGRIYTEQTYLPHIKDIRDRLSRGETIYGELDHPDDRFDIKVEKASHMLLDVYYDKNSKRVMGKIRLLDTPSGRIAKALVEAGGNVYVSSRAQGYELENGKVELTQIMTWDIVATPGFQDAVMHTVNESAKVVSSRDFVYGMYEEYKRLVAPKTKYKVTRINESEDIIRIPSETNEAEALSPHGKKPKEQDHKEMSEFYGDKHEEEETVVELSDDAISRIADEMEKRLGYLKKDDKPKEKEEEKEDDNILVEDSVEIVGEDDLTDEEKRLVNDSDILDEDSVEVVDKDDLTKDEKEVIEHREEEEDDEPEEEPESTNESTEVSIEDEVESFLQDVKTRKEIKESTLARHPFVYDLNEKNKAIFESMEVKRQDEVASQLYNIGAINFGMVADEKMFNESFSAVVKGLYSPSKPSIPEWVAIGGKDILESYNALPEDVKAEVNRQSEILVLDTPDQVRSYWRDLKRARIIVESKKFTPSRLNESKQVVRGEVQAIGEVIPTEDTQLEAIYDNVMKRLGF